jgi:hypothetical protein
MNLLNVIQARTGGASQYATSEEFCQVFVEEIDDLYPISFLLTADHDMASQCFVAGVEDCAKGNKRVFREWAGSWVLRTIVTKAIHLLQPHPANVVPSIVPRDKNLSGVQGEDVALNRVLALAPFERFVFVMSVLEHYSEHDCALLLACSPQDVRRARVGALEQLAAFNHAPSARECVTDFQRAKA